MNELANPIRIKEMGMFNVIPCIQMVEEWLSNAYKNGVDVPELYANVHVYAADDVIFSVEYVKMICNLTTIFREIFDNELYYLRLRGIVDNSIYSKINFHKIFGNVNNHLNSFIDDEYLMYEFGIYHSEISLETAMSMYDIFNDSVIEQIKDVADAKLLKYIFNKHNVKYIKNIYDNIFLQLENVFSIYF